MNLKKNTTPPTTLPALASRIPHLFRMVSVTLIFAPAISHATTAPVSGAEPFTLDPAKSLVHFDAIGYPSALKIHGDGKTLSTEGLVLEKKEMSGSIVFNLESLETGIGTRDHHMKEKYLETGKYPQAKLQVSHVNLGPGTLTFPGQLTLHGVTKPVTVTATHQSSSPNKEAITADFAVKLTDYGIAIPSFAGVTVAEDVKIKVTFEGQATPSNGAASSGSSSVQPSAPPASSGALKK